MPRRLALDQRPLLAYGLALVLLIVVQALLTSLLPLRESECHGATPDDWWARG